VAVLKRLGVSSAVVGHSERRTMFAMSNDVVRATGTAARRGDLTGDFVVVGGDEAYSPKPASTWTS
jgi:triosephosphate isomerase